jgi:tRNA pseudouridine55 synthase
MKEHIPIWKPENISSYDVIRKIKSYRKNIKLGHCGTLDPFASGVLLVCSGKNTKNISQYMSLGKVYTATIKLNEETDTLDNTGKIIKINKKKLTISKSDIEKSILKLVGENVPQVPPYFSAKKFYGLKMYQYARNNIFVRRKPMPVNINSIDIIDFSNDYIKIKVKCGKGVYIRSIARDLANNLNSCGHLIELSRVKIGEYDYLSCFKYEDLKNVCA